MKKSNWFPAVGGVFFLVLLTCFFARNAFAEFIIDNGGSGTSSTGVWSVSGGASPYGADSLWSRDGDTYTWQFTSKPAGTYEVFMWWSGWSSRATNVPVTIVHRDGSQAVSVNQQQNAGKWNSLGQFYFNGAGRVTIKAVSGSTVSTCADAVRFVDVGGGVNQSPVAVNDTASTPPGTPVTISVVANDTDDVGVDAASVTIVTSPSNGVALSNGSGSVTYTPNGTFTGTDTFTYTVADGQGAVSNTATVTVTVGAVSSEVVIDNGDPGTSSTGDWSVSGASNPYGADSFWSRDGSTYTWSFTPTVSGNYDVSMWWTTWSSRSTGVPVDIEHSGGTEYIFVNQQQNGGTWNSLGAYSLIAGVSYTVVVTSQPGPSSTCADAVKFAYLGGGGNQPPVAKNDSAVTTRDLAVSINVISNDTDDVGINPASVAIMTSPANGTAVPKGDGTVTYTPGESFTGTDTFTYTVADGQGAPSNTATVTVTVNAKNQPPVAGNDAASTTQGTPVTINVVANDTDDAGIDAASVTIVTSPSNGIALPNGSGAVTYTPNGTFTGTDTFTYTVADGQGAVSNSATVTVTVNAVLAEVVIDSGGTGTSYTGGWEVSGASNPYGAQSFWSRDGSTYTWSFTPTASGNYDVSMWWTTWPSRSSSVPVDIKHYGGTTRVTINQQLNGGQWNSLGLYSFAAGVSYTVTVTSQSGPSSTCADAVKFTEVGGGANQAPVVDTIPATYVTSYVATVNGMVNPNGQSTTIWFEWGTSPTLSTFSTIATQLIGSGSTSQPFATTLSELNSGTTYYFRIAASNAAGTSKGSILSFGTTGSNPPYPPSPIIKAITWAPASTIIRRADGSDIWPITWGTDNNLYTAYGDGWGFDPKIPEKLSLGFTVITGSPPDFSGVNYRSPTGERTGDGATGGKPSGMLMVDGGLYMWVRNLGNSQLAWSNDNGTTWSWSTWKFTTSFGCPTFLNFGKNYEGARDGYVYVYSPDNDNAYIPDDRMVMARVPKGRITDRDAYEFFQGFDANGNPLWTIDITQRQGVFTHPGKSFRSSISYHAPSKRYLWTQTLPAPGDPLFGQGFAIFDAPEPWGPWTTVYITEYWDVDPGETSSFPTKWMSDDGKTLYLVFSGDDSFSVRMATLTIEAPPALSPVATTDPANLVTINGATVNGMVNPNGQSTTIWFEWGTDPVLGTFSLTSTQSGGSGTTSQAVNAVLSGLSPGATYYFRVAASNSTGTTKGSILGFSTTAIPVFNWGVATPESQGLDTTKLNAMWGTLKARNTVAFLVVRNDKIVYERYVSSGRNQKYGVASVVKGMVGGMSLMTSMSDGLISLDDVAMKYVPQWAADPVKSTITMRHLATHTSGLEDAEEGGVPHEQLTGWKGDFWARKPPPDDPFTLSRDAAPVLHAPGSVLSYSNPAFAILSIAVTAALKGTTNEDIRSLLSNRIMSPIGVPGDEWDCGYDQTFRVDGLPLVATWGGGNYSPDALARVGRLMLRRGDWEEHSLLNPSVVREATTSPLPGVQGYGLLGWWGNIDHLGNRISPSLPNDAFYALGAGYEVVLVIPSLNMIMVRVGEPLDLSPFDVSPASDFIRSLEVYLFEPLISAAILPTVTTSSATSVTTNGASMNGAVDPNGQATTAWFEWGTDPALSAFDTTSGQSVGSGTTPRTLNAALSGLDPGAAYFFRVAASNSMGITKGSILTFSTTGIAPAVTTSAATSVTAIGATVNGDVNPNGQATTAWFEWGTDPGLGIFNSTPELSAGSGTASQPVIAALSGLSPGGYYFFRTAAANATGTTRGSILAFSTMGVLPEVTTSAATSVTASGATVNGDVNPNGQATIAWFEWGADPGLNTFSATSSQSAGSGTTSLAVSAVLSGLSPGGTYYFRAAASNSMGTSKGSILIISTTAVAPTVSTNGATSVTDVGATINGSVKPNGNETTAWFEWGTDPGLTIYSTTSSQSAGSGTTSQVVGTELSGLSPGGTYYFRVAASNAIGTSKGSILSFNATGGAPTVTTDAATSITGEGATINGSVSPNGQETTAWFEWGTDPGLTVYSTTSSQSAGSGTTSRPVNAMLSGLSPGTKYYFRAVASNGSGTQKGDIKSFATGAYYVAVGDSITAGSHDDITADGIGFEPILGNLLAAAKGVPVTIANEGVSGATSADGIASISSTLSKYPSAKYYLVMYGTNDAYNPAVPSGMGLIPGDPGYDGSYKDHLQKIVSAILAAGKIPYLAEVPYTSDPLRSNAVIYEYNAAIDELFITNNILVTPPPFYQYFQTNPVELADGIHPNGTGYQSMANLWVAALP